jgi:hypothetical protein
MRKVLAPPAIHFKGTGWAKKERAASRAKGRTADEAAPGGDRIAGETSGGKSEPSGGGTPPESSEKPAPASSGRPAGTGAAGDA